MNARYLLFDCLEQRQTADISENVAASASAADRVSLMSGRLKRARQAQCRVRRGEGQTDVQMRPAGYSGVCAGERRSRARHGSPRTCARVIYCLFTDVPGRGSVPLGVGERAAAN